MMKKIFLKLSALLFVVFAGADAMKADIISDIAGSLGSLGPEDFYYTQLEATPSPAASGRVQLMWIDMMGDTINANDFPGDDPQKSTYEAMYALLNPGASGYPNPTGYGDMARLAGTTVLYGEMEAPMGSETTHIYITSYAYFKAEAQPADGWYFSGWSYVDNGLVLQVDTLRSGNNVLWPTDPRDPNEHNATIFKVKPHNVKGSKYLDPSQVSPSSYDSTFRYVQAIFKPVLLTGYRGGKSEIEEGETSVTFDIYVDVEAKKPNITINDFNNPTFGDAKFSLADELVYGVDTETGIPYIKASVTFTAPSNIETGTFYKTTMTASSKGGSTIAIPLEVRAVAADRTEATLYNADKTVAKDGNLQGEDGVLAAITGTDQLLQLNKNYASALTLSGKTVTLNLNGYTVSSLTIAGGTVTVDYSKYDNEASGALNVTSGKAILNGGVFASLSINAGATVDQNGATITGSANNAGTLNTTEGVIKGGLVSTGTLDVDGGSFKGDTAIIINDGTALFNRGTAIGAKCGLKVKKGTAAVEKLMVLDGDTYAVQRTGGSLTINNGKFGHELNGTLTFNTGYFKNQTIGVAIPEGKRLMKVSAGVEYEEGYRYFVGNAEDAIASGVGVCRIGSTSYVKLEDAIAYANNNPSEEGIVIIMTNDYVLPAGYYTLPANATIVVPMSDLQTNPNLAVRRTVLEYQKPSEFRRLTFASGVNMEVFGAIEVSCTQHAYDTGNGGYNSNPWGPYGLLVLEEGSTVTLQDGSNIYAWGFIIGSGEMDARRGATVHEQFQMGDWKGGTTSFGMLTDSRGVFPVTQYYIQNIESPVKYHPGSVLAASAAVSVLSGMVVAYANDINIVGVNGRDDAMFLLDNEADADNTWISKRYDVATDMQVYEVNNTAHIGSLVLKLGKLGDMDLNMNSAIFKLPITNNMKIHLLSGFMDFTQDAYLLPGSMVEVDKKSVVAISKSDDPSVHSGALYVYDADDWGDYVIDKTGGKKYAKAVPYEPIADGRPSVRPEKAGANQTDATILVHGQFDTYDGYIYTSNGGANICSTNEDAGTFTFSIDAKAADYTEAVYHADGTSISDAYDTFSPAKLRNAEGAVPQYSSTGGMKEGFSYCYMDDHWTQLAIDPDDANFMREWFGGDNYGAFYIKPAEYVKVSATKEGTVISGNSDHTFSDAAGTGRLFILLESDEGYAQWWEVENVDNLYHCIHPNNDTYYYWNGSKWVEQRFIITWKNWDGTILKTIGPNETLVESYSVAYGTQAVYLGTNPTREATIDYTYDFTGWNPQPGRVTGNVTYTATYNEQPRKYTIIFVQEGGKEIERQFLTHEEVPVCEHTPTRVGHTLVWSPAISPVIGDQIYTATWLENPPTEWDVTFVNNAGGVLQATTAVGVSEHPVYGGGAPAKENADHTAFTSNEYTYTFWGWSAAIDGVAQQFAAGVELPCPTAPTTYTAVYTEAAKKYTVIFQNEDGSEIERHDYGYGETPVCSATPTKANTAEWTYGFAWTPQIQSVQGAATYRATFPATKNKYTITLQCNLPGKATFTGAGVYNYGTSATITATPAENYEFVKWQEREGGANLGAVTVNGNITLTAVVKETAKPAPENLTIGIDGSETIPSANDYMDVTLTSDGVAHSGQIINANNITLYGNADFVLSKEFAKRKWYCVAVPWRVEANGGIYIGNSSTPAVLGTDIEICYYDGAVRAAQGKVSGCWVYMKNLSTKKILEPGRAYMIALLRTSADQMTFRKKVQEPLLTTETSVQAYPSATATDANWNAIANPSLFHAYVNAGSDGAQAQRYNSANDSYDWFDLDDHKLVVGEPIYVQAPAAKSIVVANGASYAPRRAKAQAVPAKYEVSVTAAGATKYADHLSITLNEDKEDDAYVIGQDLVKFGVSAKVAQMWIDRYDAKLCVNTVAPEGDVTTFPMSLFAPKAGDYTIAIEREKATEDYNLYLTYNGEAIWNLSEGAYVMNLEKGTYSNYGLRVSARAPQATTGIDEAVVDAKGETRKVLINDQVFIIRGEKVYSIDGQLVK